MVRRSGGWRARIAMTGAQTGAHSTAEPLWLYSKLK
jgi:hypothetical protein